MGTWAWPRLAPVLRRRRSCSVWPSEPPASPPGTSAFSQNATAAQTKFWGSLLRKYGPTAAKLAGHAIKAYMGLAQTSTTAVQKEKWLGMALGAAKMGWNMY